MKNILLSLFVILLFTSCDEDFLELTPISEPNVADFYETPTDILNGVNAAYSTLQSGDLYGGRDLQDLTEYRGDNAFDNDPSASSGIRFNLDVFLAGSANEIVEDVWQRLYQCIYRCNIVLDNIPNVEIDASLSSQYQGELRFIRALSYFHAVQLWGAVPLVLQADGTAESQNHIRNAVPEVYAAIEADLQFAATNLPASYPASEMGRATSGAASGLLGKVFLTQGKFAEAASTLQGVINSGVYSLQSSVADVFDPANEMNSEILFAVAFTSENPDEDHSLFYSSGIGDFLEPSLLALYEENDERRDLLELITPEGTATVVPAKYFEELSSFNAVGTDFIVLRFADVLLMAAEALNELGGGNTEALDYLNQVRTRAGLAPFTTTDLSSQDAFREAVLLDRRLELPLENHRWYDLLRTGRAIEAMAAVGQNIDETQLLFPIPNSQILIYNNPTGFQQNPGY